MSEKCKLLAFVCSNSTWKDGRLIPQYRQPFDLVAVTNKSYQLTKATSPEESGLCPNWLPPGETTQGVSESTNGQALLLYDHVHLYRRQCVRQYPSHLGFLPKAMCGIVHWPP